MGSWRLSFCEILVCPVPISRLSAPLYYTTVYITQLSQLWCFSFIYRFFTACQSFLIANIHASWRLVWLFRVQFFSYTILYDVKWLGPTTVTEMKQVKRLFISRYSRSSKFAKMCDFFRHIGSGCSRSWGSGPVDHRPGMPLDVRLVMTMKSNMNGIKRLLLQTSVA